MFRYLVVCSAVIGASVVCPPEDHWKPRLPSPGKSRRTRPANAGHLPHKVFLGVIYSEDVYSFLYSFFFLLLYFDEVWKRNRIQDVCNITLIATGSLANKQGG